MAEYIEREALLQRLKFKRNTITHLDGRKRYGLDSAISQVRKAPAADVVEVVRCKNCRWWGQLGCAIRIVDETDEPKENDFCSFGERREENAER